MKKIIRRIGALVLGAVVFAGSSMVVCAKDDNYTYNYDWWGDVQDSPNFYTVDKVYTSSELGLERKLMNPQGLYVRDNVIYICDSGNNRIIELESGDDGLEIRRIITEFRGNVGNRTFSNPTDVAVSEEGDIFIADQGNSRILKLDKNLNYLLQFDKPDDSSLSADAVFSPSKIAIDTAGRVYCSAAGINLGLLKYEMDGTFSSFVGATKVKFDMVDYLWKKFATQEQRDRMVSFVPTEYDNLYMDHEGFIYVCTSNVSADDLRNSDDAPVRRLNLLGNDILVQNGEWGVYGDLYTGTGGGYSGVSQFKDITTLENDVYVCMDQNRGRLFGYDDQGHIMFVFGGNSSMNGYFKRASAIEHMGRDLLVLDSMDCSLTIFRPTEFGNLVYQAMDQFDQGEYDASGETWEKAMRLNGNYDLAYIGIGRSLLRQERYREAMDYFELKYDVDNYSLAFKQYRKQWVEDHIGIIMIVLLVLIVVPLCVGKVKAIKHEIDIADIFRR